MDERRALRRSKFDERNKFFRVPPSAQNIARAYNTRLSIEAQVNLSFMTTESSSLTHEARPSIRPLTTDRSNGGGGGNAPFTGH